MQTKSETKSETKPTTTSPNGAENKPATKPAESTAKPGDATKPAEAAKPVDAAAKPADSEAEATERRGGRRGTIPTMPECIIYRLGGKVHAVIHHPVDGTSYAETGKGDGAARGALEDSGFKLSLMHSSPSAWIAEKLPEGAELIGYCDIKGFPLPKQS